MGDAGELAGRPSYEELEGLVAELRALVAAQQKEIAELRARLDASSRNSSRPPSSDGLGKPRVDEKKRSLRRRSGRKPGGQEGHEGTRLEAVGTPDERVEHPPGRCGACHADLSDTETVEGGERRQVFDVPPQRLRVVEHFAALRRCGCGQLTAGEFPQGVGAPTQYGPGLRALGVYLCVFQHLPYDRAAQALADLAGAAVSTATLCGWVTQAADGLADFDGRLRELLVAAPVAHFDETGARIAGRLGWVHSASTDKLTRYTVHPRRGGEAIDAAGVLHAFEGVAVHDGWTPYRNYPGCEHALCNVHHLRELEAAGEQGHLWPVAMSCLLLDTKSLVEHARAAGGERLDPDQLADLAASYETVVAMGHDEHPAVKGKRTKAHNLLLRLERDQGDVLRFAHDFRVPFGNNQAEQDIRMVKLQQKISGCWRTQHGAQRFLAVRSYISTARKNGLGAFDALAQMAAGEPWLPPPTPT